MSKRKRGPENAPGSWMENLRLNPQLRLCARFDADSIAKYPVAKPEEMGFRVVDNCVEDNIL